MNGDIEFPISRRMDEVLKSSGVALSLSISVWITFTFPSIDLLPGSKISVATLLSLCKFL